MNEPRFDLEAALATWRHFHEQRRAFSGDDLDELEEHVRDEVETICEQGLTEEVAFRHVMRRMGDLTTAEAEYRKVRWGKLRHRHQFKDELIWRTAMLKNYLTVALRTLARHKSYTAINLVGLTVALVCCLFILLYIREETSYDRFHEQADQIYRVVTDRQRPAGTSETAFTSALWAPRLQAVYPEVQHAARLMRYRSDILVRNEADPTGFFEPRFFWADAGLFDIFSLPFVEGNLETALAEPNTIVLSESMAHKYFGEENALGQTMVIEWGGPRSLTVAAVMRDMPATSHFRADFLGTFLTIEETWANAIEGGNLYFYTYLLLPQDYAASQLEVKLPDLIADVLGTEAAQRDHLALQPLTRIHLHSQRENEIQANNDVVYLYLLGSIGVFILLVACINFINLSTAKAARRIKEVGVRKTLGGQRGQLAAQFLGESLLIAFLSVMLAAVLTQSLLSPFNRLVGKELVLDGGSWGALILPLLALIVVVGVLAGSYPAFYLSGFHPIAALRGRAPADSSSGGGLRKGLVVFQFTVTLTLICCTFVASEQTRLLREHRLGFDKEQLLMVPLRSEALTQAQGRLKAVLRQKPGVSDVTLSSHQAGGQVYRSAYRFEAQEEPLVMDRLHTDHHFAATYGIDLIAGRSFSEDFALDTTAFLLNEKAVQRLGLNSPDEAIGLSMSYMTNGATGEYLKRGEVVGVVQDFHFRSLHSAVEPLVIDIQPARFQFITLRLQPGDPEPVLATLQETWKEVDPATPLTYQFVDQRLGQLYLAEARLGRLLGIFTMLSVMVACLGLFALATFTAEQRTKEIGIRKVLGASTVHVMWLLLGGVLKLLAVSCLFAFPLVFLLMQHWLRNFAYQTGIGAGIFVAGGGLVLALALLSTGSQALAAATRNPVLSLKHE